MNALLTPLGLLSAGALGLLGGLAPQPATSSASFLAPVCDPGPRVYNAECNGQSSTVQLDGTASTGTGTLTFFWDESCPDASFDDPSSPMPVLTLQMNGSCLEECGGITLTVSDSTGSSSCKTAVVVRDTTPPVLTCPPDVTVQSGDPTDPVNTGTATASDACAGALTVTWADVVVGNVITRTWSTTDGCFPQTCVQTITIEEGEEEPGLDIKPTSCPNPVNVKSKGVIPVAIAGAAGWDVGQVDPSTLLLSRNDGVGGSVAPVMGRMRISDTSTPFAGDLCDCHGFGSDGFLDLNMKFKNQDVVNTLLLTSVPDKTTIQLDLTGSLLDGTSFTVSDCVRVQNK